MSSLNILERRNFTLGVSDFATSEPLIHAENIIAAGMDFIEPGLAKAAAFPENEFLEVVRRFRSAGIRVQSMNWFLPPTLKVTGPDVDDRKSRAFLESALGRAEALGARAVVFGSPASRSIPSGFSPAHGRDQMIAFCQLCAEVIREGGFGMRIAVEHVNHTETNFINTFAEALEIVRKVDCPEIGLTADFYHFAEEKESTEIMREAGDLICAVQYANPTGRGFPKPGDDIPGLVRFFEHLEAIHYTGGVSIEAKPSGDLQEDCRQALAFLGSL